MDVMPQGCAASNSAALMVPSPARVTCLTEQLPPLRQIVTTAGHCCGKLRTTRQLQRCSQELVMESNVYSHAHCTNKADLCYAHWPTQLPAPGLSDGMATSTMAVSRAAATTAAANDTARTSYIPALQTTSRAARMLTPPCLPPSLPSAPRCARAADAACCSGQPCRHCLPDRLLPETCLQRSSLNRVTGKGSCPGWCKATTLWSCCPQGFECNGQHVSQTMSDVAPERTKRLMYI